MSNQAVKNTSRPSGQGMAAFIYGQPKGSSRFVGTRKKRKVTGKKR